MPLHERTVIPAGQTITHYRILSRILTGEPGELYRAEDLRGKRAVALRILSRYVTRDLETRERFMQEVRAASGLDHPNICAIADIAETEDGRLFMAMVCYEGETIGEKLLRGPLSVETSIAIARQMTEGLTVAHENNIVHGHLQSANVMVTGDGVVKLMDFGLPHDSEYWDTREKPASGAAEYRSPEQLRGETPDERSDIWAFGLILYEMLTGMMPFRAPSTAGRIASESIREVGTIRPDVPGSLSHLCARCLAIDPQRRPQTMSEVQSLLGHWPFEISTEGQSGWNRVRGRYIAAGVGALVVLTGLLVLYFSR
ncbi:MAG: serine/threonine protein kinase [Bacteroidetes bacterium]|nr:serine/threonine protein kinase [Bacteroidota bacterium]